MIAVAMDLCYEPMEHLSVPRPVDRIRFVAEACRDRKVLDLGAMDETAFESKHGHGTWLHEEIANVAVQVLGVDNSPKVPAHGLATAANAKIVQGNIHQLGDVLATHDFDPEIIVAGEVIEHLQNPLAFLHSLAAAERLRGCDVVLTTPNATAIHNVLIGMLSRESTHRDHLFILSFKTLNTLCRRAGLKQWDIVPYRSAFTEMRARNRGLRGLAVAAGETAVNAAEWLFPLLSFGYVLRAKL
jgi:2-polyprenyl-3-methyl-5-hydroxy-6-metoxy-1,4-benzoquinol methylase